jgi:hypothetical protein
LDEWPPEGRTLGDIVEQLIGSAAFSIETSYYGPNAIVTVSPERKTIERWYHPLEAIAQPLLQLWNSGALIAKGRRCDPFSPPIEIPPPSTVWEVRVVDFTRSVIEDPIGLGRIYDLRFFLPKSTAGNVTPNAKNWVDGEIRRMIDAGEIHGGVVCGKLRTEIAQILGFEGKKLTPKQEARLGALRPTDFAKALKDRMRRAAKIDDSVRPVRMEHLRNQLVAWGYWPLSHINIK